MASVSNDHAHVAEPSAADIRLVVTASALGTVFEWYDFFIYGTLTAAKIIQHTFLPPGNETLQTLLAWAGFAVGFAFRPLGAILFGYLGDKLGRKYTFLVTITLMGVATAGVGFVPGYDTIGIAAPLLIILLRIAQGLALGGEYGGAAIYVSEHSPGGRSGYYTSFIQAGVVGGFILSLAVVLMFKAPLSAEQWSAWGWRLPFLFSIVLLAVSLWIRLKLSESPVFTALKKAGKTAANPFVESFTYPGNPKRLFVALFGVSAGMTVIWYTSMFGVLQFLSGPMRIQETAAQLITAAGAVFGTGFYVLSGFLSDRIGRKTPIVAGYVLALIFLFPLFWLLGHFADPGAATGKHIPSPMEIAGLIVTIMGVMVPAALAFGPLAACLTEMFPPRIRYSSMSIPYHFGTGYFGGFLPLVSAAIVAHNGNPYSGLWYTIAVVAMALVVTVWGLKDTRGEAQDDAAG